MNNLRFLTSLKGIAAWCIVLFHIKIYLAPYLPKIIFQLIDKCYLMVDFFFLLSGFLISYNYLHSLSDLNLPKIKYFYIKRIVRIYPLHFIVLLTYTTIPLIYTICGKSYPMVQYKVSSFIQSIFLVHNWGMNDHLSWNIPSWAVSVKIVAYLLFPLIAFITIKYEKRFTFSLLLLLCLIIYLVFSFCHKESIGEAIPKLGLIRGLIEFILGVCICVLYQKSKTCYKIKFLSLILLVVGLNSIIGIIYFNFSDTYLAPISITILLFVMLIHSKMMSKLIGNKLLVYIGKMSYSTYMIHYFLRDIFKLFFLKNETASILWIVSYCSFVVVASYITFKYIESPIAKFALNKFIKTTR